MEIFHGSTAPEIVLLPRFPTTYHPGEARRGEVPSVAARELEGGGGGEAGAGGTVIGEAGEPRRVVADAQTDANRRAAPRGGF